jgi:hypothetical protein
LSRDCRQILASNWYRGIFPTRLSPQRAAVPEFDTTDQGCRLATSVGGVLSGRGADIVIIDDPLKPEEALSQTQRQIANEWYDHTLYSRLNDKLAGAIVLIMHRLHEDDLVGHVLAQERWEVVCFPAIAEEDEALLVDTGWGHNVDLRDEWIGGRMIEIFIFTSGSSISLPLGGLFPRQLVAAGLLQGR